MNLIPTLILAHLLADFPLQTNTIAVNKAKSVQGLVVHVFVYVATSFALLGFRFELLPLVSYLGLSHLLIDSIKTKGNPLSVRLFLLDQAAHIGFVLLIGTKFAPHYHTFRPVLNPQVIDISVIISAVLAIMVMFWLWANNLTDETINRYSSLRWGRKSLLELEQRAGFGLICFLGIGVMLIR